ncbi:MAG TPA: hypothetical protein VM557_01870 [Thermoanaerobaculia bacterium]|nr:hypothetical protein [Thermoanaerobaculia bacterium]
MRGGELLLLTGDGARWIADDGATDAGDVIDAFSADRWIERDGDVIRRDDGAHFLYPATRNLKGVRLVRETAAVGISTGAGGESIVRLDEEGGASLAGPFERIDSFAFSPDGTEIVFSAKRESFDVGLMSVDGGEVRWVGTDPLDETMVSWAPRGNKIAYRIDGPGGDVVRSVHIPTGFQVAAAFPSSSVSSLAWEPVAERFAVVVESAGWSPRVENLRYSGAERVVVRQSSREAGRTPEPLGEVIRGILLAPQDIRYGEKLPLVIWFAEDPHRFSPERAELAKNHRAGLVVLPSGASAPNDLVPALSALPWVDTARIYIVANGIAAIPRLPEGGAGAILGRVEIEGSDSFERVAPGGDGQLDAFAYLWLRDRLAATRGTR